jgi:hypothetical protein
MNEEVLLQNVKEKLNITGFLNFLHIVFFLLNLLISISKI